MGKSTAPVRFTGVLERSENKLWGSHVVVPASVARKFPGGATRRVVRTLNGSQEHQCALLPFGKGTFVLSINKQWCSKLGIGIGSRITVTLRSDESTYGLPVPEEFSELLRQDREGSRLFHALTPGRQRTLLYIVGKPANADIRAWQASVIIRHLKENLGKLNYRQLNGLLKRRTRE